MSADIPFTVRLNNHFQSLGRVKSISYVEEDRGPAIEKRWSITVKIDGVVMGSYNAPRRAVAKEEAAKQALTRLGLEHQD